MEEKKLIAFIGMPGSGKSEVVAYLQKKGIPFVRFGQVTDEGVAAMGLPLTPDNERVFREKLRADLGMEAYAIRSKPKIDELIKESATVALDGLYSWEEYVFLMKEYPTLLLVHVYADRVKRYERLAKRPVRPVPAEDAYKRDFTEVEGLHKAGPIAMADYLIENNSDDLSELHQKVDNLLARLHIQ